MREIREIFKYISIYCKYTGYFKNPEQISSIILNSQITAFN